MNARQTLFVQEYLKDFNASAAYLRAGYQNKNPESRASILMASPEIKEAIQKAMAGAIDDIQALVKGNIAFWLEVRDGKPEEGPGPHGSKIPLKADLVHRLKASELLGKYAGMFIEKVEHSGTIVNINDDIK